MLKEVTVDRVYLAQGVTDLRKSIDGLICSCKRRIRVRSFSSSLFVFVTGDETS
ncbi:IS66 family insertion sequence element accessory protein TnpB [Heyndrickxia sporothermodurans]|uniref:IS66 family insertion sequence element accessory protein TnpB n=1 Tax=Heyndrickxia sporothermodurans TaxID=46224 RepID=A0AB37HIM3_9BACI|nr:IS66 family insertion sequence element accessory protein TnpB [Heyndrickxia sporothermodurans]